MIAESMRAHVLPQVADLGLGEAEVMLTATHTHSARPGFSTYLYYGLSGPGFSSRDVRADRLVAGSSPRFVRPSRPCSRHLRVVGGDLPVEAVWPSTAPCVHYNQNPDVTPVARQDRAAAVERRMTVLRVDAQSGQPLGLVSWFGVHCTTVHRDCKVIHPDRRAKPRPSWKIAAAAGTARLRRHLCPDRPGDVTNVRFSARAASTPARRR